MDIHDIIKTDSDRIFVISPECYIIFTGDTLEDVQPFIRVGNSRSLPVRIVPLVENIIITDVMLGNPVNEQFNIDVQYLPSNRYIGSRLVVKKFLDFQKLFDLNLENISIVDVEKDLPEYSKQKNISDKDSFIGVFYRDGNFRIMHSDEVLFDLKDMNNTYFSDNRIHELLSENAIKPKEFDNPGFVPMKGSLLLYRNRQFCCIDFPEEYYGSLAKAGIDPARIRDICIPGTSIFKMMRLAKWKNSLKGKIRLFTDEKNNAVQIDRLFNQCTINHSPFSGMKYETGDAITIYNVPGSANMMITYKNVPPARQPVTIGYINDYTGVEEILKSDADVFIVKYSVFESATLMFKSIAQPLLIMDDGNTNIRKLDLLKYSRLNLQARFELSRFSTKVEIENFIINNIRNTGLRTQIGSSDFSGASSSFQDMVSAREITDETIIDVLNSLTFLRLHIYTTTDRKVSNAASRLAYSMISWLQKNEPFYNQDRSWHSVAAYFGTGMFMVTIHAKIADHAFPFELFETIDSIDTSKLSIPDEKSAGECVNRIAEDRKRLEQLLDLYYTGAPQRKKDIKKLKSSIQERENEISRILHKKPDKKILRAAIRKKRIKAITKKMRFPLLLLITTGLVFLLYTTYNEYKKEMHQQREQKRVEKLIKEHDIRVSDTEIYHYANKVALRNGYAPMNMRSLKNKNPNWIFPGNAFTLLDGQEVHVQPGDTLWGIAEEKLMEKHIQFYTLMEKLKDSIDHNGNTEEYLRQAKSLAFSEKHTILIKKLEDELDKKTRHNDTQKR
ncbi:MAG: hypothetical protein ACOCX9_00615 [Spirochaetota bacterium]